MTLDRQRGCLTGLAVGDALGAAVEFKSPGSFEPVTDYRAGGPHRLGPGEWTDDTSMALALADSIGQGDWDLDDQARRYVSWWRDGKYSVNGRCFDIGNTTADALHRFQQQKDGKTSGSPSSRASGNGGRCGRHKAESWYTQKDWGIILEKLVDRIYLLRCQLVHGAATLRSRMNRTAVKHCTTMMAKLMPTLLLVWIDHGADEDWGIMCYPPVDAGGKGGR